MRVLLPPERGIYRRRLLDHLLEKEREVRDVATEREGSVTG